MFVNPKTILIASIAVLFSPHLLPAQDIIPTAAQVEAFARRARAQARTGQPMPLPSAIFKSIVDENADEDEPDCPQPSAKDFEAHRIPAGPRNSVAVLGGGACACSPTGNCDLWIYEFKGGAYHPVLSAVTAQSFGFLKSQSHGWPDLVVWSHGSATETGARLFRFRNHEYVSSGAWDEEFEYLDDHGEIVTPAKPRITSYFGPEDTIPSENKIH
jgi:hypothetical protein